MTNKQQQLKDGHCRTLRKAFARNAKGTTAVMFALALPAVMAAVGLASDFAVYNMKRTKMQAAADQAAIAGAKELTLSNYSDASVLAAADGTAKSYMGGDSDALAVEATIVEKENKVKVRVAENWTPFFAHFIGADITPIVTNASAGLFGESKICVLALSPTERYAVGMFSNARLRADDCTVYSNSSSSQSVSLGDSSSLDAKLVCTVGGVNDNGSLSADKVVTDCPVLKDPLASRVPPSVGACDATDFSVDSGNHTLNPGVYCGGIKAKNNAVINFKPGDYIIKDGPLLASGNAQMMGKDVGFFMTGLLSTIWFLGDATIDLAGREDGTMAGMLFFDDPKFKGLLRTHTISATNARNLTGTIYLPGATLWVDPTASVGEESAYTAIVAKRLVVQNGPTLVLNTDYNKTPVPVPDGIRAAADILLVE